MNQDPTTLPISRQINLFIRKHPFLEKSLYTFTKSKRRQFERNLYDFGRGLGLKKSEARKHVIKVREFCGEEEEYDNEVSALGDEFDDSAVILNGLSTMNSPEPVILRATQDPQTRQSNGSWESHSKSSLGVKRRSDVTSNIFRTPSPSKKRKASCMGEDEHTAPKSELVRLNEKLAKQKVFAKKGAQGDDPVESSHRSETDSKYSAMNEGPAESAAKTDEEKAARKAAKKPRNAEERMRIRAQASPADNKHIGLHDYGPLGNETKAVTDYINYLEEWRVFDEDLKEERKKRKRNEGAFTEIENSSEGHHKRTRRRSNDGQRRDSPQEPKSTKSAKKEKQQADFRLPMIQSA